MDSKREERNEKIIRGLMKLPPNRRCINCNSSGPQYVCTNFWTFVCMTCSGIHREFTHRVKSISMSKFTSQEVEALQNGGNQHAREIYLKGWDLKRQRLPDNSNVDNVRNFIKSVYIDKRYAGKPLNGKPPLDSQNERILQDQTRRPSSYHSYSQSPPYDFQYEDRRYGKNSILFARRHGSERSIHVDKIPSFVSSPNFGERAAEGNFTSESNHSRFSPNSFSSEDGAKSSGESPDFQVVSATSRSSFQSSSSSLQDGISNQPVDLFSEDFRKNMDTNVYQKASTSAVTLGVNSPPYPSHITDSASFGPDFDPRHNKTMNPPSPASVYHAKADPIRPPSVSGTNLVPDLFKSSLATPAQHVNRPASVCPDPVARSHEFQVSWPAPTHPVANPLLPRVGNSCESLSASNSSAEKGWATFDTPQFTSQPCTYNPGSSALSSGNGMSDPFSDPSFFATNLQRPGTLDPSHNTFSASINGGYSGCQPGNAPLFEAIPETRTPANVMNVKVPSPQPSMETKLPAAKGASKNPFDLPCDSELEQGTMFFDMRALEASMPDVRPPFAFLDSVT